MGGGETGQYPPARTILSGSVVPNRDSLSRPLAADMRTGSLAACGSPLGTTTVMLKRLVVGPWRPLDALTLDVSVSDVDAVWDSLAS